MCYSTMIEADLKKLGLHFGAFTDWTSFGEAYQIRDKYPAAKIPMAIDIYLMQQAQTRDQKTMAEMAKNHYRSEVKRLSLKLEKWQQDCRDFATKIKNGSKAKDLPSKLEKRRHSALQLEQQITQYRQLEPPGNARIFPNYYAPVIVQEKNARTIKLMRYQLLPAPGKELPAHKYNLFNARRDRLLAAKTWNPLFGHHHAIFPFLRFYENVDDGQGGNRVIYFASQDHELMWSAALFTEAKIPAGRLRSFAAITDEPPPEVLAAGHDRCPIFLAEKSIDAWLSPHQMTADQLLNLLDDKAPTYFVHDIAA